MSEKLMGMCQISMRPESQDSHAYAKKHFIKSRIVVINIPL